MILHVLRALFVLLMAAVGFFFAFQESPPLDLDISVIIAITLSVLLVCLDILSPPRRKLAIFSGTFLGLVVGLVVAFALSFLVRLLVEQYATGYKEGLIRYVNTLVSVAMCYLAISVIMQTKDDFRFILPYVEFSKQTKGARPILVDTSVLIDGRITDIVESGIVESQLVVPQFVLTELQQVADSPDKLKRNRGRRGLDVLAKLRNSRKSDVALYDPHGEDETEAGVDQRLMTLAKELNGRVLTNDYNLNKVAQLHGVDVINLNDLANAMKPAVLPGEKITVRIQRPGEDAGQGIGYLDDGTMVVVEGGRDHLNEDVEFTVTNTRQTSAGKMIFGRVGEEPAAAHAPAAFSVVAGIMPRFAVIIPAAGSSSRFGAQQNKLTIDLAGIPVVARALLPFVQHPDADHVFVAVPNDPYAIAPPARLNLSRLDDPGASGRANAIWNALARDETLKNRLGGQIALVPGGPNRAESVRAALKRVPNDVEFVAIHDAARPMVTRELIDRVLAAAVKNGAAAPALAVHLTVKQATGPLPARVQKTVERQQLWAMQTPQIIRTAALVRAYEECAYPLEHVTDDLQLLELTGQQAWLVEGDESNIKITTRQDLLLAEVVLRSR